MKKFLKLKKEKFLATNCCGQELLLEQIIEQHAEQNQNADFIYKIQIVEEEADESVYWLELISESNIIRKNRLESILKEANELTAIFTSSGKTAKQRRNK
jgi:four helix bundle protein